MGQTRTLVISFGLVVTSIGPTYANCLNPNADTRLRAYCVGETLENKTVSLGDAQLLDALRKREGFATGVGLPFQVEQTTVQPYVSPILEYNTNINAGNPSRPLILGGIEFTSDEEYLRKEGVVAGLGVGLNGRHIYGEGKYLDFSLGASYAHSPKHDIGIARAFASLCSRNHISNNWFADGCANTSRLNRDLDSETKSNLQISTTKLFSTSENAHHSVSVGLQRYFEHDSYQQNQLVLGWETARTVGAYTSFNLTLGEDVPNTLATRYSISTTVGTELWGKALTASVGYSFADGGNLFGVAREDKTSFASVSYAVHPKFSVTLGYKRTSSTIDYFSENEPTVAVQLAPIRF